MCIYNIFTFLILESIDILWYNFFIFNPRKFSLFQLEIKLIYPGLEDIVMKIPKLHVKKLMLILKICLVFSLGLSIHFNNVYIIINK